MRDYYQDGFDSGYGNDTYGEIESPETDGERYDYKVGAEDGQRRRDIADELEKDGW